MRFEFALAVFQNVGPVHGPIIGGTISESLASVIYSWRGKTMRRLILLAAICGVCSSVSFGQGKTFKVYVTAEKDAETQRVKEAFAAKVGSTLRYSLTNTVEHNPIDIMAAINCLAVNDTHVTCYLQLVYWPYWSSGLSADLNTSMATGPYSYVAEVLFNDFVTNTADDELGNQSTELRKNVKPLEDQAYIRGYSKGVEDGKNGCKPQKKPTQ